ncbi:LysR substrate binding domain-containing protein [Aminobacter aminovorans]|uniref:LysR substrate-binding domain-containing protein n=1 Tax=Aminobacter aminovorans TaxID=83263 RepID=A0A380WHY8_AMIAI|nr:hypothetical protein [Aminobacter aminovorans]TCS26583.1 LysR substrate binding domain-containing protein [Aminobacter aminovorans]SUU88358.1 Uncharacterised protein [Aminobacter aminovorans]
MLPPGTWRVSDLASKLALIQAGVGWGNLPQWMVDADLAHGTLVRIAATALGTQSETALPPTCSGASTNRQTPPCAAFASGCLCVSPKVDSCAADSVEAASQIAAHYIGPACAIGLPAQRPCFHSGGGRCSNMKLRKGVPAQLTKGRPTV